jgi:hypothetical protein
MPRAQERKSGPLRSGGLARMVLRGHLTRRRTWQAAVHGCTGWRRCTGMWFARAKGGGLLKNKRL